MAEGKQLINDEKELTSPISVMDLEELSLRCVQQKEVSSTSVATLSLSLSLSTRKRQYIISR